MSHQKYWIAVVLLVCLMISPRAQAGGFIEGGPNIRVPFAEKNLDWGPGFQLGAGYDWGPVALRGGFYYTHLEVDKNYPPGVIAMGQDNSFGILGASVDLKMFPLEWAEAKPSFARPYLILGAGGETMGGDTLYDAAGFVGNAGLGLALHFGKSVYMNFENTVRPGVYWTSRNDCVSDCKSVDDKVAYAGSMNLGVRF